MTFKEVNVTLSNHATEADPGGSKGSPLLKVLILLLLLLLGPCHMQPSMRQPTNGTCTNSAAIASTSQWK